ncbi:MAG: extracellular solute-binding protein [Anaerolineae bacterium]|nr:extracellular solute-binding protein [Anaerolineae bacterium]
MLRALRRYVLVLGLISSLLATAGCDIILPARVEPITLRYAYREGVEAPDQLLDLFEQRNPGITIERVKLPRFNNGTLATRLRAGEIDVFRDSRDALSYARQGLIIPLQDLLPQEWQEIRDDYYPGTWEALQVDGQQWGIPAGLDLYVFYVNMTAMDALGLEMPTKDWSLTDLVLFADQLNFPDRSTSPTGGPLFGFCTDPGGFDPLIFIYMHGGSIVDDINNPTLVTVDDPLVIEAVQWYSNLLNQYDVVPDVEQVRRSYSYGFAQAAVVGACGIWMGWFSNRGGLDTPYKWTSDWAILPPPQDAEAAAMGEVDAYYVTNACEEQAAALELIRFLSGYWEAAGQKLPPRRSVVNDEDYADALGYDVAQAVAAFPQNIIIVPAALDPTLEQVGGALINTINRIVENDLDAESELVELQDQLRYTVQE